MRKLVRNRRHRASQNARRRLLHFEQCEERLFLSVSPSGDAIAEAALFAGAESEYRAVRVRIETTDMTGSPISEASVGEEFLLNLYVQDTRETASGVYAAYLDLLYNPELVRSGDVVQFGSAFTHGRTIGAATPGLLDEVGGFSGGFTGTGSNETLLVSMPFVATSPGRVDFVGDQPDYVSSIPLVFGHNFGVPFNEVDFGATTLNVLAGDLPGAPTVSINDRISSNNSAPMFLPIDSFRNADQRFGTTSKLSDATWDPTRFVPTRTVSPLATNGGFNDLDRLQLRDESGTGGSISWELDSGDAWFGQAVDTERNSPLVLDNNFSGREPITIIFRNVEYLNDLDGRVRTPLIVGDHVEVRPFTAVELPAWRVAGSQLPSTSEFDAESIFATRLTGNASPPQVARAATSGSISTTNDDSGYDNDSRFIAFSPPTENGGYINLADLRQVARPKPVDIPQINAIQIARTDNSPTSGEVGRSASTADKIALASLTWQLQVDGLRGDSLTFEMAGESPVTRAARPNDVQGVVPRPRNDSGNSIPNSEESAGLDTPIMPPHARTTSINPRTGAENVRDEGGDYLAVSPLIVIVAGSLLVTEGWQKLQPREAKT